MTLQELKEKILMNISNKSIFLQLEVVENCFNEYESNKIDVDLKLLAKKATQKKWVIKNENIVSDEGHDEMKYYHRGKLVCNIINFNSEHGDRIMSNYDAEFIVACVNYVKELLERE